MTTFLLLTTIAVVASIDLPALDSVHMFNFAHDALASNLGSFSTAWPFAASLASLPANVVLCRAVGDALFAFDNEFCEIVGQTLSNNGTVVVSLFATNAQIGEFCRCGFHCHSHLSTQIA